MPSSTVQTKKSLMVGERGFEPHLWSPKKVLGSRSTPSFAVPRQLPPSETIATLNGYLTARLGMRFGATRAHLFKGVNEFSPVTRDSLFCWNLQERLTFC